MSKQVYDKACWVSRFLIPALAVLYGTLGKIWNLPLTSEIVSTITAIGIFINAILKKESDDYFEDKL